MNCASGRRALVRTAVTATVWLLLAVPGLASPGSAFAATVSAGDPGGDGVSIGEDLPLWSTLPFIGILLSIALFPLIAPRLWHQHYPKIAFGWAVLFALPFLAHYGAAAGHEIVHIFLIDYLPFILLLWGLFTVAGGIVVRGTPPGRPGVNTALLLVGTLIASWMGTTGASILLIRPLLRANAQREHRSHVVVFFIFLVANIGGCLTPLGDPPLFLGFLHHVPFTWTLRLFPEMAFASVWLLVIFYLVDRHYYRREAARAAVEVAGSTRRWSVRLDGAYNLLFLAGILGAVLLSGFWDAGTLHVWGVELDWQNLTRDGLILLMGGLSLLVTPKALRQTNGFTWGPIREVAYLFAGIFMTIIPALAILKAGARGHLAFVIEAVREPWQYFWAVGGLSSFLDNAPTYLTFFNSLLGRFYPGQAEAEAVARLIAEQEAFLVAISLGAVFMGANTYIGNAPNFMVKSIAEEGGVAMPSFFGYMIRWSLPILIPLFAVSGLIFL